MKRPKSVKVGPLTYRITYGKDLTKHGVVGRCWTATQRIQICSTVPEDGQRRVLMHEILHALAWTYGVPSTEHDQDAEEAIVTGWCTGLMMLLEDNPAVADYIAGR